MSLTAASSFHRQTAQKSLKQTFSGELNRVRPVGVPTGAVVYLLLYLVNRVTSHEHQSRNKLWKKVLGLALDQPQYCRKKRSIGHTLFIKGGLLIENRFLKK